MVWAPVYKTQMSPFNQMVLLKRITVGEHKGGVCAGLSLMWLKQRIAGRVALSSERVAYLRANIEEAGRLQSARDLIGKQLAEEKFKENKPEALIRFFKAEGLELYGWYPGEGLLSLGDTTRFRNFAQALASRSASYPAWFAFSLMWMNGGLHMWAGEMANDGIHVFDPNFGEFWAREPAAVLDGLYDLYQSENNSISYAQILLIRPVA